MDSNGISAEEACSANVIGTEEDFVRLCNPDGSLKKQEKTTTFHLKNDDTKSVTVKDSYIHLAGIAVIILLVVGVVLLIRKFKK